VVDMKSGRIVADGPAGTMMLERESLEEARVSQPQLVTFYQELTRRPEAPFVDPLEAERWLK